MPLPLLMTGEHGGGAGRAARTFEGDGTDPVGFVLRANLRRRYLDESQRAA